MVLLLRLCAQSHRSRREVQNTTKLSTRKRSQHYNSVHHQSPRPLASSSLGRGCCATRQSIAVLQREAIDERGWHQHVGPQRQLAPAVRSAALEPLAALPPPRLPHQHPPASDRAAPVPSQSSSTAAAYAPVVVAVLTARCRS